jgi:hypothetical protein
VFVILAAVAALTWPPAKPLKDDPRLHLASITLTGAGKAPGGGAPPPPPPAGQFFFPTGTNLILAAATL